MVPVMLQQIFVYNKLSSKPLKYAKSQRTPLEDYFPHFIKMMMKKKKKTARPCESRKPDLSLRSGTDTNFGVEFM
jgi:hypothetical protein